MLPWCPPLFVLLKHFNEPRIERLSDLSSRTYQRAGELRAQEIWEANYHGYEANAPMTELKQEIDDMSIDELTELLAVVLMTKHKESLQGMSVKDALKCCFMYIEEKKLDVTDRAWFMSKSMSKSYAYLCTLEPEGTVCDKEEA